MTFVILYRCDIVHGKHICYDYNLHCWKLRIVVKIYHTVYTYCEYIFTRSSEFFCPDMKMLLNLLQLCVLLLLQHDHTLDK
jgi:hypothetical protein